MKLANRKNVLRTFLVVVFILVVAFIGYLTYIWFDTQPVMDQLEQITEEQPNSREMFKDDFWLLVPEADEDGNITRRVTKITRDYLWVWGNKGSMKVNIFLDDKYSDGTSYSYEANWNVAMEKINGKWEIVDYKNIP